MKFKVTVLVISLVAIALSIATEIKLIEHRNNMQSQFNRLNSKIEDRITDIEKEVSVMNEYFEPNGIVEKFIVSNSFLEKHLKDLDLIITNLDNPSDAGYMQIYIIGSSDVWVAFRNSEGRYVFQGNLKPGLNPYKFYFFKEPSIETQYTYIVPFNSSFKSGVPENVFFLIKEPGQYRLIKHPNKEISNIMIDLNLYIPTVSGK